MVCPSCVAALTPDAACGCAAATRLEYWNGVPRILYGQPWRGECSLERMAEILSRMDSTPWRTILREAAPDEPGLARLTDNVGTDFVHGMPWDEIEMVLDVGSGMGFMTAPLARLAKTVVAVEEVPERALFQRKRAAQDGFSNWHPLIAGAAALPFASETFDLVALNGAFARSILAAALRLLKPGGYLYASAENRFALGALRRGGVIAGAGFARVDVFGAVGGREHQKAVYRLDEAGPRRFSRELADPPSTRYGKLLRRMADMGPWRRVLEDAVVVFARKGPKSGRLVWPDVPHDGPISQFSSGDKVFIVCFDEGPTSVFKGAKTDQAVAFLAKEHDLLREASRRHPESGSWPLRWPKPLGVHEFGGRKLYRYEFAAGSLLSAQLKPVGFRLDRFERLFSRFVDDYVELCAKMTPARAGSGTTGWDGLLERLAAVPIAAAASARIKAACARLRGKGWPLQSTHGDLSLSNAMLLPSGGAALIDWENASEGFPAIDLMRLINDVLDESALLKPALRRAAVDAAWRSVRRAFERLGVGAGDEEDVEALFVADQFRMWLSRDADAATSPWARKFLERYGRRELALAVSPPPGRRASAG